MVFRTHLSAVTFQNKYAHEGAETWEKLCGTLVEDVCRDWMSPGDKSQLKLYMSQMKALAGGRYLYYAGRPIKAFNNCAAGETALLTDQGHRRFDSFEDGEPVRVYSPISHQFELATMHHHGEQEVFEYTLANIRGRSKKTWKVRFTADHKWPTLNRGEVTNLQIGDVIGAAAIDLSPSPQGVAHGRVFADGSISNKNLVNHYAHQLRLCGAKAGCVSDFLTLGHSITYPSFSAPDPIVYVKSDRDLKSLPTEDDPLHYVVGFIKGWVGFDGYNGVTRQLHSIDRDAIQWFTEHAHLAGYIITGDILAVDGPTNFAPTGRRNPLYRVNFQKARQFQGFKVVDRTSLGHQPVYCPFEPKYNRIVVDHGIDTFNCYLLRSEEDTRQDWANLSWKAESCLATGGGIGNDYTIYRPRGSLLKRTGGVASGPVSKMRMINEIGREVMQGGSRRSAIYASLDESHPDIHEFLSAKDWQHMLIPGTDVTYGQVKQADFNFPCPLDMTNISVNYGNDWLANYWMNDDLGDVFMKNVRQAMMTGEPGFSFNFFEKQNETLRNAPVSADTWVMTNEGYQQVENLIGTSSTVWTGKQWAETTFKKTKNDVRTVIVEMTGGRVIKADPEHEFLVERYMGGGVQRRLVSIDKIPAGALEEGDILHVSLPHSSQAAYSTPYLQGFLYGDGSFRNGGAEVTFCTPEKKQIAQELFSEVPNVFSSINWNDSRGYTRAYLYNQPWFKNRRKDAFPTDIPVNQLGSFLAGLFDADGSYDEKQHRIRLSSVHYEFLEGARRALEMLGVQAGINKSGESGYGGRSSYLLVVCGSSVARFTSMVPCRRLRPDTDFIPYRRSTIKVLSVTDGPIEDVYCCDVGVPEHSFCAEGVIISNCTEVTSEDDSDVCNLGSVNLSRIETLEEFEDVVRLMSQFLLCGTMVADLPYDKVYKVREKNRRLGLGLMGVHEWLIQRGARYEVTDELHDWLAIYRDASEDAADELADHLGISHPVAYRAIAPTGTIGILAGTTTGIEPLFAVAYKRRYLTNGTVWKYQYVIDGAAQTLIDMYDADPLKIETALDLAQDWERRIRFQADVQDYVDMSISSTINLPAWGSDLNNEDRVEDFADTLARYAHRLRGFTVYPDGARGGQPLTAVSYFEAKDSTNVEFEEHDICDISGKGGTCGA